MYELPPSIFNDSQEPWLKKTAAVLDGDAYPRLWVDGSGELRAALCCPPMSCCIDDDKVEKVAKKALNVMLRYIEGSAEWSDVRMPVWFIDIRQGTYPVTFQALASGIQYFDCGDELRALADKVIAAQLALDFTDPELELSDASREVLNDTIMWVARCPYRELRSLNSRDQFDRQMAVAITAQVANRWVASTGRIATVPELRQAVYDYTFSVGSGMSLVSTMSHNAEVTGELQKRALAAEVM